MIMNCRDGIVSNRNNPHDNAHNTVSKTPASLQTIALPYKILTIPVCGKKFNSQFVLYPEK